MTEESKQKTNKNVFFKNPIITLVILLLLGYFAYKTYAFFSAPVPDVAKEPIKVAETDWIKGENQAQITLIEYGDFQCPACGAYYPLVKKILEDYPDDLRVVFRHFPLPSHKNAYKAAIVAEAAGKQDQFWQMHNILFEKQDEWSVAQDPNDIFLSYAQDLGLDKSKFSDDLNDAGIKEKIDADMFSGNKLGVNATPTFFLEGKKLKSVSGYEEFSSFIEEEVTKHDAGDN
jgi:protein-disulfide isomerase